MDYMYYQQKHEIETWTSNDLGMNYWKCMFVNSLNKYIEFYSIYVYYWVWSNKQKLKTL
jgi:hypothetical protein